MSEEIIDFLIKAKKLTYAGKGAELSPSRPMSHDLSYAEGEMLYYDSFLGGDQFAGEEALWIKGLPFWSMNYAGRVTGDHFSGDFLKEALRSVPRDMPYRGPLFYSNGAYTYTCSVSGGFEWFQGHEAITYQGIEIYDCFFHGGIIK